MHTRAALALNPPLWGSLLARQVQSQRGREPPDPEGHGIGERAIPQDGAEQAAGAKGGFTARACCNRWQLLMTPPPCLQIIQKKRISTTNFTSAARSRTQKIVTVS